MSCSYNLGIYDGNANELYKYSASETVCKKGQTFTLNENDPNLLPVSFQCPIIQSTNRSFIKMV